MFDQLVRHFLNKLFELKPPSQFRTQITRLRSAAYSHLNIRFVFRCPTRISSFFLFKDKVPKFLKSGVVYLFKCRCCSASYVGQTTRHLHTRVSEHLGISPITGKPSSSPPMSSIFCHLKTTGHTANFDDFEILSSYSDDCELMIHESLLISKLISPLLMFRAAPFHLTFFNFVFLLLSFLHVLSYPLSVSCHVPFSTFLSSTCI